MSRILLNGLHYEKNGAGISKYNHMLLKTFIDEKYDIDILMRSEFKHTTDSENVIFANEIINGSKDRIIYEQWKARNLYKNYDLIHFPDYATPVFYKKRKIATIHDMAMHTMRSKRTFMQNLTKNIFLKDTIKSADKLICVSEFAKNELLKYYPYVENKIKVIYEGIGIPETVSDAERNKKILNKFDLTNYKYILYVGTIAPHKNIMNLIRAFYYIRHKIPGYKLVIVGKKGWMYSDIFNEVENLKLKKQVVFTDFISDSDLEIIYRNASLFTTVSFYEGFGFPPLEAMARKIPVLISDIPVFKEICADCAEYCNPYEIEDIAIKIEKLLEDDILREKLILKGYDRVKEFTWSKAAKETYKLYMDIL